MPAEQVADLTRRTLEMVLWMSAPILIAAAVVSLVVSIAQVLTSVQDATIATVPRLAAVAVVTLLLAPWMLRRLVMFTLQLFSDFRPYLF
jgi:flagellar biosynthetic protein FliQ